MSDWGILHSIMLRSMPKGMYLPVPAKETMPVRNFHIHLVHWEDQPSAIYSRPFANDLQVCMHQLVAHPTCVDAHVLKGQLEVRDVVGHTLLAQQLASNQVGSKQQLLTDGQHHGAQGGDVGLQCLTCKEKHSRQCFSLLE